MADFKKTLSKMWDRHGADILAGTAGGVTGYFAPDLITDDPTEKTRYTSAGILALAAIAANRGIAKSIDKGAQGGIGSTADKAQGFLHGIKTFLGNDGGKLEPNKDAASGFRFGRALNPLSSWDTPLMIAPAYAGLTYGKGMWDSSWAPKLNEVVRNWKGTKRLPNPWHGQGINIKAPGKLSLFSTKRLGAAAIMAYLMHAGMSAIRSTPYSE